MPTGVLSYASGIEMPVEEEVYYEAAEEPYRAGSPFTDAQIFSNLGMAYSSIREYKKAYMYLTKAWDLGCQNASVSKELEWLRSNAADLI